MGAWTHSLAAEFFPPLLHHITPTQAEDRGLCFDNSFFWQPGQIDSEPDTFVSQAANQKTIFSRLISSISLSPTPQQQKPCSSLARAKTGAGMCKWWYYSGSVSWMIESCQRNFALIFQYLKKAPFPFTNAYLPN